MSKKKGRDWSEWQKHLAGQDRIEELYKRPNLRRRTYLYEATSTGIIIPKELSEPEEKKKISIWVILFFAFLALKWCHHTFFPNIRSSQEIQKAHSR